MAKKLTKSQMQKLKNGYEEITGQDADNILNMQFPTKEITEEERKATQNDLSREEKSIFLEGCPSEAELQIIKFTKKWDEVAEKMRKNLNEHREQVRQDIQDLREETKEEPLDLAPYAIKPRSTLYLAILGAIFSIFGVFVPNAMTPTLAYLCLLTIVAKNHLKD